MWEIELVEQPSDEAQEPINAILRQYNAETNAEFWQKIQQPAGKPVPLCLVASDQAGATIGGLIGETRFSWLTIHILAVRKDLRGGGIGTQLMLRAESEGRNRGCRYAFLDCMDYHAPRFYERLGYSVVGTIDDWDSHGHVKYFFNKDLLEE